MIGRCQLRQFEPSRRQRAREAHAFEVDETHLDTVPCRSQHQVTRFQVAVSDAGAMQIPRQRAECRDDVVTRQAMCLGLGAERAIGRDVGCEILEHDARVPRKTEAFRLDEGERTRGTDASREQAMAAAPRTPTGRAAPEIGQRGQAAARTRLFHDDAARSGAHACDGAARIALQHVRRVDARARRASHDAGERCSMCVERHARIGFRQIGHAQPRGVAVA